MATAKVRVMLYVDLNIPGLSADITLTELIKEAKLSAKASAEHIASEISQMKNFNYPKTEVIQIGNVEVVVNP